MLPRTTLGRSGSSDPPASPMSKAICPANTTVAIFRNQSNIHQPDFGGAAGYDDGSHGRAPTKNYALRSSRIDQRIGLAEGVELHSNEGLELFRRPPPSSASHPVGRQHR